MAATPITYRTLFAKVNATHTPSVPALPPEVVVVQRGPQMATIIVPPLPPLRIPYMQDITLTSNLLEGEAKSIKEVLHIDGKKNTFSNGGQVLINADRIILNTRVNYLMLFGGAGVAISSEKNVNIDADEAVTVHGATGVFIGVPGGGGDAPRPPIKKTPVNRGQPTVDVKYEPMVLGLKLVNFLNDLLITLETAVVDATIGKSSFGAETIVIIQQLACRIPEMLSDYAYVDGISHEATLTPVPPDPTKDQLTVISNVLRGNVTDGSVTVVSTNPTVTPATQPTSVYSELPEYGNTTDPPTT